jgi:hypothetical protein
MGPHEALELFEQVRLQAQLPGAIHDQLREAHMVLSQMVAMSAVESGPNGEAAPAATAREVGDADGKFDRGQRGARPAGDR